MTTLLPLFALVLAVLGFALGRPPGERGEPPMARAIASLLLVIVGAYAASRFAPSVDRTSILIGFTTGAVLVLASAFLPKRANIGAGILALGTAGPAFLLWLPDGMRPASLALMVGLGFVALTMGDEICSMTAIAGSLVAAATMLGADSSGDAAFSHAGVALGLGVALLGILKQGLDRFMPPLTKATPILVRLLGVGLAFAMGSRYLGLSEMWLAMALACGAGLAVAMVFGGEEVADAGRGAVAAILWVGLGTLSFGLGKGYGMSMALLLAAGIHIVLGERRALLSAGPLLGLVLYRIFREAHVDASRALDIGQHYALIGLLLGIALPLLPDRWWAQKPTRPILQASGGFLWALLWTALPPFCAVLLGPKGVSGFIVGMGISGFLAVNTAGSSLLPSAIASGASALAALTYGWMDDLMKLTRDEKLHWLIGGSLPLILIAACIALLGHRKMESLANVTVEPA